MLRIFNLSYHKWGSRVDKMVSLSWELKLNTLTRTQLKGSGGGEGGCKLKGLCEGESVEVTTTKVFMVLGRSVAYV